MKQLVLSLILSLFCTVSVFATVAPPDSVLRPDAYNNSVYIEGLGNGVFYSVNYERLFWIPENKLYLALRAGFAYIPQKKLEEDYYAGGFRGHFISIPFELSVVGGKQEWKYDMGFGITYTKDTSIGNSGGTAYFNIGGASKRTQVNYIPVLRIGTRWQPEGKHYFVRLGFTPLITDMFIVPVAPWVGLGAGYRF